MLVLTVNLEEARYSSKVDSATFNPLERSLFDAPAVPGLEALNVHALCAVFPAFVDQSINGVSSLHALQIDLEPQVVCAVRIG